MILTLWSCNTDVDLCYYEHPHRTLIDFRFKWSDDFAELSIPDSMNVIAFRPINTFKYGFIVSSRDKNNDGILVFPVEERKDIVNTSNSNESVITSNNYIWMRPGKYDVITYNGNSSAFENIQKDEFNELVDLEKLIIKYKVYDRLTEHPHFEKYKNWVDRNPYSSYVLSEIEPIYYSVLSNFEVPDDGDKNVKLPCNLIPEPITQKIQFQFVITKKEEGICVDSLKAELSGIPVSLMPSSKVVDISKTYKVLFEPCFDRTDDPSLMSPLRVSGEVNVSGLVRSYSPGLTSGPGIMQLNIYTHMYKDGIKYNKIFRAGINLYHILTVSPLLERNPETGLIQQSCRGRVLVIPTDLQITKDKILETSEEGLDNWECIEKIEVDI